MRFRQSDHINASMNREAYAAVQSGFLKAEEMGKAKGLTHPLTPALPQGNP